MHMENEFRPLPMDCQAAVAEVQGRLERSGLAVLRSFDLSTAACVPWPGMPCPHHGNAPCKCQLVVLLVYEAQGPPVSLMAHGHDAQTWFSIVEDPQGPIELPTRARVAAIFDDLGVGVDASRNPEAGARTS